MKSLFGVLSSVISAIIVMMAALLVGVRLFGLLPYAVLSSSMEPAYPAGALIYVRPVPADNIQIGDAISFVMNEDLVVATHRVVEIDTDARQFRTKGDANTIVDGSPVHFNNLLGKVVFSIPYLGYIAHYIASDRGRYVAIAIILFCLLWLVMPGLLSADKKPDSDAGGKNQNNSDVSRDDAKRAPLR